MTSIVRPGPVVLEIGYWVHSAHTGIERIEIHHDPGNPASGRVAAKAGFREAGRIAREKHAPADTGTDVIWARSRAN